MREWCVYVSIYASTHKNISLHITSHIHRYIYNNILHTFNTSILKPQSLIKSVGVFKVATKASVNCGKIGNNNCLAASLKI